MITIIKKPDKISPVFSSRNKFEVSEVGATFFTFVFSGAISGTFKVFANAQGVAEFNARFLLENYIKSQIALPEQSVLPEGILQYDVNITSSLSTAIDLLEFKFFNGALQDREANRAEDGYILNEYGEQETFFNGFDSALLFDDLTGINIVRYEGSTVLSIVGNKIIGTRGTLSNLLLDNGCFFANPSTTLGEVIYFAALFNRVWDDSAVWNDTDIWNDN